MYFRLEKSISLPPQGSFHAYRPKNGKNSIIPHGGGIGDRKFLFSLSNQEGTSLLTGRCVSVAGSTCPISMTPPHRPSLLPAAFCCQYTHHGTGINSKPEHTSGVEGDGVDGGSPAPGCRTAVRKSLGMNRGRNRSTAAEPALGVSGGRSVARYGLWILRMTGSWGMNPTTRIRSPQRHKREAIARLPGGESGNTCHKSSTSQGEEEKGLRAEIPQPLVFAGAEEGS
jgi:hypothetical protein